MSGKRAKSRRRNAEGNDWRAIDRKMLADDVDWVYSLAKWAPAGAAQSGVGVSILVHIARVAHEGLALLKQQRLLDFKRTELTYSSEIAAARHAIKLLDDDKKSFDSLLEGLRLLRKEHHEYFKSSRLEVMKVNGKLAGSSLALAYQVAFPLGEIGGQSEESVSYQLTNEIGRICSAIALLFGSVPTARSLDTAVSSVEVSFDKVNQEDFYTKRYGERLPVEVCSLLLLTEISINSALEILEPSSARFTSSVFRARFVVLAHAISTVDRVIIEFPNELHHGGSLRSLIDSPGVQELLTMRQLRNRCMHYGIPSWIEGLSPSKPGYGLVEATTEYTFQEVDRRLIDTLQRLSRCFHG